MKISDRFAFYFSHASKFENMALRKLHLKIKSDSDLKFHS